MATRPSLRIARRFTLNGRREFLPKSGLDPLPLQFGLVLANPFIFLQSIGSGLNSSDNTPSTFGAYY